MEPKPTRNTVKKIQKNVKVTKPSTLVQEYYRTVVDSGIDVDGMTKAEICELAKVILLSKGGSEVNQANTDTTPIDLVNDTDNEEDKNQKENEKNSQPEKSDSEKNSQPEKSDSEEEYVPQEPTLREDMDGCIPQNTTNNCNSNTSPRKRRSLSNKSTHQQDSEDDETQNYEYNATEHDFNSNHRIHKPFSDQKKNQSKMLTTEQVVDIFQDRDSDDCDDENATTSDTKNPRTTRGETTKTTQQKGENDKSDTTNTKVPTAPDYCCGRELFASPVRNMVRHHRRKKRKVAEKVTLYSPDINNTEMYAKVIGQLFDIYHRKITRVQAKVQKCMPWGEPVKVGKHWNKTIDVKKRGGFIPLEESDDENMSDTKDTDKKQVRVCKSDDVDMETEEAIAIKRKFPKLRKTGRCLPVKSKTKNEKESEAYIPDFDSGEDTEVNTKTSLTTSNPKSSNKDIPDIKENQQEIENMENSLKDASETDGGVAGTFVGNKSAKKRGRQKFSLDSESEENDELGDFMLKEDDLKKNGKNVFNLQQTVTTCKSLADKNKQEVRKGMLGNSNTHLEEKSIPIAKVTRQRGKSSQETISNGTNESSSVNTGRKKYTFKANARVKLKRNFSDLSVGSTESGHSEEEFIKHLGKQEREDLSPERPASRGSESSMDRLSQRSKLMIDPQGELYSTQFCVLKEKSEAVRADSPEICDGVDRNTVCNEKGGRGDKVRSPRFEKGSGEIKKHSKNVLMLDESSSDEDNFICLKTSKQRKMSTPGTREDLPVDNEVFLRYRGGVHTGNRSPKEVKKLASTGKRDQVRTENDAVLIEEDSEDEWLTATEPRAGNSKQTREKTLKTYSRSVKRRPCQGEEMENKKIKLDKPEDPPEVPCPICFGKFRVDKIEQHAADCDGTTGEEHLQDQETQRPDLSPDHNTDEQGNGNQTSEDNPHPGTSTDDGAVSRDLEACFICDQSFPKGPTYDTHVDKCIKAATKLQEAADSQGYGILIEEEEEEARPRTTRSKVKPVQSRLQRGLEQAWSEIDGYSSGSDEEKTTLKTVLQKTGNEDSGSECSESDYTSDSSGNKTPVKDTSDCLPGGWTAEELDNSPIRTFVPIWHQKDSGGFKNQFLLAQKRHERQVLKKKFQTSKPGKQKRGKKRKRKFKGTIRNKQRKLS